MDSPENISTSLPDEYRNYAELKRLAEAIASETDATKRNELIKERVKLLDPRMEMLPCGITRGNNNIIRLLLSKMPAREATFDFESIYNSVPQEDFNNAHGHIGSWASHVTGGVEVCFRFFTDQEFINSNLDKHQCKLTDKGLLLREKGDYENYVDFIVSQKNQAEQRTREVHQLARRQASLAERQLWINFWIAGAGIAAGIYYLLEIHLELKDKRPQLYEKLFPALVTFEMALVTFGLVILLWRILKEPPDNNNKI